MERFDWKKRGHIFAPNALYDWMHYYAAPVTSVEFDDFIRVYFTTRGKLNEQGYYKTQITFLDCKKDNPSELLYVHNAPLISVGNPGTFDEHGTMVAEVFFFKGEYWMYYMGWQRSDTVPYLIRLGVAKSKDGKDFKKVSEGPVIGMSLHVPFGIGNVSVLVENDEMHMWYTHFLPWLPGANGYKPSYDIRYARSKNGLDWEFSNHICIAPLDDNEAIATPCVRKFGDTYHMWYSYREGVNEKGENGAYRIGYATSKDKLNWSRMDSSMNLSVSPEGWDQEMVCYPDVLSTNRETFMFYCGNHYGQTGFGYAALANTK